MFKFRFFRLIPLDENNAQTYLLLAKNIPDVYTVLIPYKNINNKQKDPMRHIRFKSIV